MKDLKAEEGAERIFPLCVSPGAVLLYPLKTGPEQSSRGRVSGSAEAMLAWREQPQLQTPAVMSQITL